MDDRTSTAPRVTTPTVSHLDGDTIIEIAYDPTHRSTSLIVSRFGGLWNAEAEYTTSTGERLIPYSARNNLIANGCVLLASKPEPFGTRDELVRDIRAYLHRYVDLSPLFEQIAAHYVLLTWVYDAFSELPYLRLRGDYGTGKTRALIAIGSICYKPFFAAGASTVSPIFHTLDRFGGTLVLDEADFRFSDATTDLVKVFNNGTVRGLPVLRTIKNSRQEFNPAAFKVFGPKIVAMRGSFSDPALESRFLTEETGTRPLRADIPIDTPKGMHDEALSLRNRLLHFRLTSLLSTKPNPDRAMRDLEPRLNQIALPLLSLIDEQGLCDALHRFLAAQEASTLQKRRETLHGRVVTALVQIASQPTGPASVQQITEAFNQQNAKDFGVLMPRRIGVVLRELRIETRKSHGNYVVPPSERSKIDALALRYGVQES